MKRLVTYILTGALLLLLSGALYFLQYVFFHLQRETLFYLMQDLAFIPIQVLLITVVLERVINSREKRDLLKKMNMVIGSFFIETGTKLIEIMMKFHVDSQVLGNELLFKTGWSEKEFGSIAGKVRSYHYKMDYMSGDLEELKAFILGQRGFLLGLLENANLLEHDTFTDTLWAVFHVADELASRGDLANLPGSDYEHLEVDIKRAYSMLVFEWIYYMKHLKTDYPYLFSLAVRKNPFDKSARVIIG